LLSAENVSKHYDGVRALHNARLCLRAGEAHALIGENGAGKSTFARILAGITRPDSADLSLDGRPVHIRSFQDAQRLGIAIIHQELDLFPSLTVAENVAIGNLRFRGGSRNAFCRPFLDRVGLECPPDLPVEPLSIAQRQLLAIARALSMDARILLMDEPSEGLAPLLVRELGRLLLDLKAGGASILLVEQNLAFALRVADHVYLMSKGRIVHECGPDELRRDEAAKSRWLGV